MRTPVHAAFVVKAIELDGNGPGQWDVRDELVSTQDLSDDRRMSLPQEALALENRSTGAHGEPTLGQAYEILLADWQRGVRERELSLHLAFLAWYMLLEPPFLTGLDQGRPYAATLERVFNEVHDHVAPETTHDAEVLYVFGLMAHLSPWLIGDNAKWEATSERYRLAYRKLEPKGIAPTVFAGRGYYGEYFAGQVQVKNGY